MRRQLSFSDLMPKPPPIDSAVQFAERLRTEAGAIGLTRSSLAIETNRHERAVACWFDGSHIPTSDIIERLAQLTGVRFEYLTQGTAPRQHAARTEMIVRDRGKLYAVSVRALGVDPDDKLRDGFISRWFAPLIKSEDAYLDPFGRQL